MFPDLPEHLQTLNALPGNTPPSTNAMNQEQEEAFWGFLHADELFRNFGNPPSPEHQEKLAASLPPAAAPTPAKDEKPTLESFIAQYIGQSSSQNAAAPAPVLANNYLMSLSSAYDLGGPSNAPTPLASGIATSDLMPSSGVSIFGDSPEDDRISGAKRLKQLGAGTQEIEEDLASNSKRRRNTEASARFRAKKKEREQALDRRAKELEAQVSALAAENASLENENKLLKAIVLNGAGAAGVAPGAVDTKALESALAAFGSKRKRED